MQTRNKDRANQRILPPLTLEELFEMQMRRRRLVPDLTPSGFVGEDSLLRSKKKHSKKKAA